MGYHSIKLSSRSALTPRSWYAGFNETCSYVRNGHCSEHGAAQWRASDGRWLCDHHAMRRLVKALNGRKLDLSLQQTVLAS